MSPQLSRHSLGDEGTMILCDPLGPSLLLGDGRCGFIRHICRKEGTCRFLSL